MPLKEFNFSKVAGLKCATLIKNELLCRCFLIGFSTVAELLLSRTPLSGCLCALLERKRIKEMKQCVFVILSLALFFVALQGARFSRGNKNEFRRFSLKKEKKIKNSQPQTKFTFLIKKRVKCSNFYYTSSFILYQFLSSF